jgi:DNA primase
VARIPEETLQAIRDRVDLVDLIGRHVHLKKSGRNFVGLCPFHSEKTPSFNVNVERQIFHCFGCGEGGNAITFLIKHENLTFPEAARTLARELGIPVPEREAAGETGVGEKLRAANQVAQSLYAEALGRPQAEAARDYLARRGLGPEEIERFGIGFAPGSGRALLGRLEREKIPASLGAKAGLLGKSEHGDRHYDMLRGRITFPIQDARGQVLGFGGRALSDDVKPKYLNTPESPIYRKREVFYGLHFGLAAMRRAERAVVVEGYFDRIAMHRAGIEEAVATCGTALTQEHARALRRRTRRVVLVFDGDEAGQHAVESSLEVLLSEGLRVEAVLLPEGQDPDDLLVSEGAEGLRARVDAAEPALDLVIRRVIGTGCATPWEKSDAVAAVAPLLARIPEAVERSEWARRLALAVDVEPGVVEQSLRRARRGGENEAREAVPEPPRRADRRVRWAQDLVAAVLAEPALAGAEPHDALCELLPESPARDALSFALSEAARAGVVDVAAIEADRDGAADPHGRASAALAVLRAVALEGRFADSPEQARRAFDDVVSRLQDADDREARRQRRRDWHRDPETRSLSDAELLAEAQRSVERRRRRSQHLRRPHGGVAN